MTQPNIVGIRFQKLGKTYHFDAGRLEGIRPGDYAIVSTRRGRQIGESNPVIGRLPEPAHGRGYPTGEGHLHQFSPRSRERLAGRLVASRAGERRGLLPEWRCLECTGTLAHEGPP